MDKYVDTTALTQFATKTKEYVDGRTAYRITNVAVGDDTIDITIEPSSGGQSVTFSVTKKDNSSSTASYYAMTIAGLGNSDPSTVTFTESGDQAFPTAAFETVTQDGYEFIKVPTMWRKVESVEDSQITSFTIANAQVDSDYQPYPCFVGTDGAVAPYVLIGKTRLSTYTPANGLSECSAKGDGYYPYDIWTHKLFQDLELAMSKKVNYNDGEVIATAQMGLADLVYDYWTYGTINSGGVWYVCYDPAKYTALSSTSDGVPSDYVKLGYVTPTTSNYITKLGYDSAHPFANFPSALGGSVSTYYCDYYSSNSGGVYPVRCLVGTSSRVYGLWYCGSNYGWSRDYGVRLCYRPL